MSERSKGDTSSSVATAAPPTSGRVVKNPLLSASVTGLTFDDFQNKPLLLPAAPPIVHPTPVVSRESTPLVTVGKLSDIDTENLSEINLNDTSVTSSLSSNIAEPSDENSNSLLESTNQIDNSILSQAASSFSQLPSVASSVFSTFSKKFNSTSGRDDFNANPQLDIQPFTTPFVGQVSVPQPQIPPPPTVFANEQHHQQQQQIALPPQTQPQAPTAVPPTFYTPTEVPLAPSAPTCPPPASGQNTYRLSARKKIYAQIPGLSSAQHEPSLPTSATGFQPPIGFEALGAPTYSENPPFEKPEERKGGLFSLSNLGVPNVLQNLSGFVQSATGISQRPQEQPSATGFGSIGVAQATPPAYYPQSSPSNFTGIEPVQTTSTGVNLFAPPVSSAPQLFIPAQVPPVLPGTTLPPQPPKGPPTTGVLYSTQPTEAGQSISTQQQPFFEPTTSSSRPPSVGSYFGGKFAKSSTPDNKPDLKAFEPHQPSQPEFNSEKTFSGSSTNLFGPPPTTGSKFSEQPPTSVTPESSPQSNLILEQTTSGPPPNLFEAPSTTESNLSVPLQSVTPELTTQTNLEFKQAASGPPSNPFGPPPGAGSLPLTSLPPDISLSPQVKPISVTPASPSQEDLNSQQTISSPPPTLFGALPTSESNLSGAISQSVTPELTKLPNLNSEQPVSTPASNFFGLPPVPGSYISGPPPKSDTAESLSKPNFFQSPSSGLPLTPGIPLPPQVKPQISGPPSAGPPSSSFRLQKGTRLYKSPFAVAQSENQPQVQIYKNNLAIAAEPVSYFNPQQTFAPPQGEVIRQPIPTQEPLPPKDNSFLHSSVTAPPLCKASEHPPTADGINYFNPQKFDSGTGIPYYTRTAAPLNILEPTAASQRISTNPINFFNPQGLNSAPGLIDISKGVAPASIQQPLACPEGVSTKPPSFFSSTNAPPIDKVPKCPTIVEGVNPQEITPHSLGLDTETVSISANLSSITDQNLANKENYLSNQAPEQRKSPPLEEVSKINPESDIKQERLNLLQEQQNNILPPPPSVNFGITTQSKETANFPPPPPQHSFQNKPISNPYRKGLQSAHSQLAAPPSLSSFFTPIDQGNNFFQPITSGQIPEAQQPAANFVTEANIVNPQEKPLNLSSGPLKSSENLSQEAPKLLEETSTPSENLQPSIELSELEPNLPIRESTPISSVIPEQNQLTSGENISEASEKPASPRPAENPLSFYKPDIAPPYSNDLQVASKPEESSKIASPLKSQDTPVPEPVPNLFTGFFDQAAASSVAAPNPVLVQRPSLPDPTTFFDSFSLVPSLGVPAPPTEDPNSQRIQNFFNNPPPKELDTVGDLNYNLVGSGLSVQNLQIRSLTPASNLAEPPSSSCSEFSELNSSLSAANRQPLIQAADSTKVSPEEEAIFESPEYQDLPEEIVNELKMANSLLGNSSPTNEVYKPAVKHWFYKRKLDVKCLWTPFSFHDSALIEEAFLKGDKGPNLVPVEGGRFDVNISDRTKSPVYWEGEPIEVKRCSWFFKANDSKYVPYEEETADLLEEEYKKASESCEWHKKIPIMAGETVVFHGPTVIVHFQPQQQVDSWGGSTQTITRPRVVKRDLDDFNINEGESHKVDHLLFMVHGIGSACDLKMRSVEEVVDEFRSIALQLVQSHYKNSVENGCVGRVEVLPVSWHSELHSDEFGIDEKLKSITLESIPKLRNFTNDTLLDILFYTSPMFCQRIINTVTSSMNDIFVKYKQRNPEFHGEVSLAGHSLGSLIMFDLLCHQRPHKQNEEKNMENPDEMTSDFPVESNQLKEEEEGKNITYKMGQAGTGQPFISYPQLLFQPKKFFALGSPIGMFVTIRGIDKLGLDFRLPTCPGFYNIFHPYDPVAYRLEALVNPDMNGIPPVLIPHHKGRKRMHLELKETMSRVGADLKQRFFETFKTTLDSVNFLTPKIKNDPKELKEEVDRLLELQVQQGQQTQQSIASTSRSRANSNSTNQSDTDAIEIDFPLGKLNDSKRVDYVLQEAPLEFFNEYLFALSSHVCYWESEDTILFVMKQIYNEIGISPDSQVPQQTMTIERPSSSGSTTQQSPTS